MQLGYRLLDDHVTHKILTSLEDLISSQCWQIIRNYFFQTSLVGTWEELFSLSTFTYPFW